MLIELILLKNILQSIKLLSSNAQIDVAVLN